MTSASTQNTRWSLVQAAKGDTPQGRAALAELCEVYYRPVESQMRRWISDAEDARDATQAFFSRLLGGHQLDGAESTRGSFRTYLFSAARHFVISRWRAQQAEKRGSDLTATFDDLSLEIADASQTGPDVEFDRAWACALLQRGLDALAAEFTSSGKTAVWEVLQPWLAGTASHGDTAQAATTLGVSETAARVQLSRLRQRLRGHLEHLIADTLAPGADPREERQHLLALWS